MAGWQADVVGYEKAVDNLKASMLMFLERSRGVGGCSKVWKVVHRELG